MAQNMLLGPKPQGEDFLKFLLKGFKLLFWIKCRIFGKTRARVLGLRRMPKLPKTSFRSQTIRLRNCLIFNNFIGFNL